MILVYIINGQRTHFSPAGGSLANKTAIDLGAWILSPYATQKIDYLSAGMGLVCGQGPFPARQCSQRSLLSDIPTCLITHEDLSGLLALIHAMTLIERNIYRNILVLGFDSLSTRPYCFNPFGREFGKEFGREYSKDPSKDPGVLDHKVLTSDIPPNVGLYVEDFNILHNINRHQMDTYTYQSYEKVLEHIQDIRDEIYGDNHDDHIDTIKAMTFSDEMPLYKDEKGEQAMVTRATESVFSDGACVLYLSNDLENVFHLPNESANDDDGAIVIKDFVHVGGLYIASLKDAIQQLLDRTGWSVKDVDIFDIGEQYATIPIFIMNELSIPFEKINFWGGALTLGHPIAATALRSVLAVSRQLKKYKMKYGVVGYATPNGEAIAVGLERV